MAIREHWRAFRRHMEGEQRFYDWQNVAPPYPGRWAVSSSGSLVTQQTAVGLPGVSACIRLVAETLGTVPLLIYQGEQPEVTRARDSWQWHRLHDAPNDEQSSFEFWQDVATSIEATGNAFIWKIITRRPVQSPDDIQLLVLDPATVVVAREGGRKVFKIWRDGEERTYTSRNILHIRGWSAMAGTDSAMSPISLHRESLGKSLATEEFEARFFSNDAAPPFILSLPPEARVNKQQIREMQTEWEEMYGGLRNAFRPAIVANGAQPLKIGISLADAQFVEQKKYGLEDIARIFRISAVGLLGAFTSGREPSVSEDLHRFLQVDMHPRFHRIETAVANDQDLFPSSDMFCEFLPDAVLRPDIQTRFAAYKDALQAGWMTANEVRERENLPAHPDGIALQQTPVGGAPNQNPMPTMAGEPPEGQTA